MSADAAIRTGIRGLDEILLGGIPKGNTILVQGETGTGKTLFGTEFIYRGITQFDEPGMIVVFETSARKIIRDAAAMGWDLEDLQARKKLQIVFTSPEVLEQEVRSPDSLLLETAAEIGAHRHSFRPRVRKWNSVGCRFPEDGFTRNAYRSPVDGTRLDALIAAE